MVLVGHVTKDGSIAGPRVLEHMVDTVLGFEGERSHQYRILRASKNRFGGTDEIGVFAMDTSGLVEVPNPSALFLTERGEAVSGTSVFPALEGTRPVLVEIQALTVRLASGATPRRAAVGWDSGRLAMVLAVLEARCGISFASAEVYLNVAGGYRLSDPAADLAVAAALVSALSERPVPANCVVLGEVALSGEIRPVAHVALRLKEAAKLGFEKAWVPAGVEGGDGIAIERFTNLRGLVERILGAIMTALDIFVILLLGGGALIGFVRGFVHEVLSLFAWIAAIAALKLFHDAAAGAAGRRGRDRGRGVGAGLRLAVRADLYRGQTDRAAAGRHGAAVGRRPGRPRARRRLRHAQGPDRRDLVLPPRQPRHRPGLWPRRPSGRSG